MTAPGAAFGLLVGSTNSAGSPVLPTSRGGSMCGAGVAADSAGVASRITALRFGSVTRFSRRMIASICSSRAV